MNFVAELLLFLVALQTMFQPEDNCAICMDSLSTGPVVSIFPFSNNVESER